MLSKFQPILWRLYKWYARRKRVFRYDGLSIVLLSGIFHPGLLYSTKNMYRFIQSIDIHEKTVLELGAGSGMIALDCARRNAIVYASDIQQQALQSIKESMQINDLNIHLKLSDVFSGFSNEVFDLIIINPPYYNKDPKDSLDHAFFCGTEFEFFQKLFSNLNLHIRTSSQVFMILADNCDLEQINSIAIKNSFSMKTVKKIKQLTEVNFIYEIKRK